MHRNLPLIFFGDNKTEKYVDIIPEEDEDADSILNTKNILRTCQKENSTTQNPRSELPILRRSSTIISVDSTIQDTLLGPSKLKREQSKSSSSRHSILRRFNRRSVASHISQASEFSISMAAEYTFIITSLAGIFILGMLFGAVIFKYVLIMNSEDYQANEKSYGNETNKLQFTLTKE